MNRTRTAVRLLPFSVLLMTTVGPALSGAAQGNIFGAAEKGDLATVRALVAQDPSLVKARDAYGGTALHHAAGNGHLEVVKFLLASGADPTAQDMAQFTPLAYAIGFDRHDIVALLKPLSGPKEAAEQAHDVDTLKHVGTAAGLAAAGERKAAFKELQEQQNAPPAPGTPSSSLVAAIESGKVDEVQKALAGGADTHQRFEYTFSWLMGHNEKVTPLHVAADRGNAKVIEVLLKKGAELDAEDGDGYTALMVAAHQGRTEALEVLLKAGAKVNLQAWAGGFTALNLAAVNNHPACVKALLAAGADKTLKDNLGNTPLDRAEFWEHHEVVRLLGGK